MQNLGRKGQPWGFREFMVRHPFGNGLLFAESIREVDTRSSFALENLL
jgi:hypothetical protein